MKILWDRITVIDATLFDHVVLDSPWEKGMEWIIYMLINITKWVS